MAEDTNERKESVKLNLDYFKTYPGFCKLILIVLNLLAFISASVASSKYTANAQVTIFLFVSMISFWISLFIVCFYLFRFDEKLDSISFSTFGFYYSCVSSIAYLASSLSVVFLGGFLAAACFFGLMAFAVYAIDAYLYYCKINGVTPLSAIIRTGQRAAPPESVATESK